MKQTLINRDCSARAGCLSAAGLSEAGGPGGLRIMKKAVCATEIKLLEFFSPRSSADQGMMPPGMRSRSGSADPLQPAAVAKRSLQQATGSTGAGGDDNIRVLHWTELYDAAAGRLTASRPAGAPAGHWPHTPWWHCVFHDKYERINFWSHAVPGVLFLLLGLLALRGLVPGELPLFVYTCCTGATHLSSAATHVYPDSHVLEKIDHIGIVATIVGTPITALMAQEHGHLPVPLVYITALLLLAAFLRPAPRVAGFIVGGSAAVSLYGRQLLSWVMCAELALYVAGAALFLRNGGHSRWGGFSDHHVLHYFVTAAGVLHVFYIWDALSESA